MTAKKIEPFDGTAIVLHLIEAARAVVRRPGYGLSHLFDAEGRDLQRWVAELEIRYAREQPALAPAGWQPRTWSEVIAGDRVSLGGVEAEVVVSGNQRWHVQPDPNDPTGRDVRREWHEGPDEDYCRSCQQRCLRHRGFRNFPLEHEVTAVTLLLAGETETRHYPRMHPDGEVEVLRGPAGQAFDEANGFRSALGEESINVLESWAEDAAITLEAAGLGPVKVLSTSCNDD